VPEPFLMRALLAGLGLAVVADRLGRRRVLLVGTVLMAAAGAIFSLTAHLPWLVAAAIVGAISPSGRDVGPFLALEQAMLPHAAEELDPTRLFGTYNTVATVAGSLGALAAFVAASRLWLLVYPAAALLGLVAATGLSRAVEVGHELGAERRPSLHRSKRIVARLSALFALDSFGGGFVVQSFIAYWFALKFDTSRHTLAVVFLVIGFLQATSFQTAVRLSGRIGLLRTMVFTHLPSNVLLAAIAFAPSFETALALSDGIAIAELADRATPTDSSSPGLTRRSRDADAEQIALDARIKSGHDAVGVRANAHARGGSPCRRAAPGSS